MAYRRYKRRMRRTRRPMRRSMRMARRAPYRRRRSPAMTSFTRVHTTQQNLTFNGNQGNPNQFILNVRLADFTDATALASSFQKLEIKKCYVKIRPRNCLDSSTFDQRTEVPNAYTYWKPFETNSTSVPSESSVGNEAYARRHSPRLIRRVVSPSIPVIDTNATEGGEVEFRRTKKPWVYTSFTTLQWYMLHCWYPVTTSPATNSTAGLTLEVKAVISYRGKRGV